jgi:D-threonine aldolase
VRPLTAPDGEIVMPDPWYTVANPADVPSPALLVYPDRVAENIRRMVGVAGGVGRLRPHMKTSKLPQVVRMHLDVGITRFKCATVAEAEMVASCGAPDVLLGYQPVGPNVRRVMDLVRAFPATRFAAVADDEGVVRALSNAAVAAALTLDLLLDLDCGMHRTGITPGAAAASLYRLIGRSPGLRAAGLHAYDGHIRDCDPAARARACDAAFAPVLALREELHRAGEPVPSLVAGGTPTFPIHARRPDVECSPGTTVFWDLGSSTSFPDLDFLPAVLLLTRVISRPGPDLLCLDLGHKAVASEMAPPRLQLLELPDAVQVGHSEEHLVMQTARAPEFAVGTVLHAIPWHVCPTVALHGEAVVVRNGRADDRWAVVARARSLTI